MKDNCKNLGSLFHEHSQLSAEFVGTKWRHVKTGKYYEITKISIDEVSLEFLVTYKSTKNTTVEWTRKFCIFMDGRFTKIIPGVDTL